jgi:accessory gene regulator B
MISAVAQRITLCFVRRDIISAESVDVYQYGLDIIISTVWNSLLILVCAVILARPMDALVYIVCTFPLRRYGGGWHAPTHATCALMSTVTFIVVSWVSTLVYGQMAFELLLSLCAISMVIIILKCPSQHPDNPIDNTARQRLRKICIILNIGITVAIVICFLCEAYYYSALIAICALSAVVTFLFKNKVNAEHL